MTPEQDRSTPSPEEEVRRLLTGALGVPIAERVAWVREQAVNDASLAEEVLRRLAGREASESPAGTEQEEGRSSQSTEGRVQSTATGELLERLKTSPKLDSDRYVLEGELGHGGMGVVMRIHDLFLNRRLAMKILLERRPPIDEEERRLSSQLLGRFLEEAQVTSQLDHPGVVPVHELGLDAIGKVWFTMRMVKGRTASEVFADAFAERAEWNTTRALEVVLKVCDTMAYAHEKGVLHRDLKPNNVMVGRFGEVYVMDWGLAKVLGQVDRHDLRIRTAESTGVSRLVTARQRDAGSDAASSVVSMDGQQLGTPSYMSPEQARGEGLDVRADVYSIGAMLYELVTGRAPYTVPGVRQPAYRILNDVLDGPPKRVEEVRKGVPAELVAVVERAMHRDREQRYRSVAELARDLRAFLAQRSVKAYRTGAVVELRLWVRRNRALASSVAAAVLVLVAGIVVSVQFGIAESLARADASAKASELRVEMARSESRRIVTHSLDQSHSDPGLGTLLALHALARSEPTAHEAIRRNLARLHELSRFDLRGHTILDAMVDAQQRFVAVDALGIVYEKPMRGGQMAERWRFEPAEAAMFSPDGSLLVIDRGKGDIEVREVTRGERLWGTAMRYQGLAFSRNGEWLVEGFDCWRRQDAHPPVARAAHSGEVMSLPAGSKHLALCVEEDTVSLLKEDCVEVLRLPRLEKIAVLDRSEYEVNMALSPSGTSILLAGDRDAEILHLDQDGERVDVSVARFARGWFEGEDHVVTESTATGTSYFVPYSSVHRADDGRELFRMAENEAIDGRVLATTSRGDFVVGGADPRILLLDTSGRTIAELLQHDAPVVDAGAVPGTGHMWSRDEQGLVVAWSEDAADRFVWDVSMLGPVELSPDGKLVALGNIEWGRWIDVVDATTGSPVRSISGDDLEDLQVLDFRTLAWDGSQRLEIRDERGDGVVVDVQTGAVVARTSWAVAESPVHVGMSRDLRWLFGNAADALEIVNRADGRVLSRLLGAQCEEVLLGEDGKHLTTRTGNAVALWQIEPPVQVGTFELPKGAALLGSWKTTCVLLGPEQSGFWDDRDVLLWRPGSALRRTGQASVNVSQSGVRDGYAIFAAGRDVRALDLETETWIGAWTTTPGRHAVSMDDKTDWVWDVHASRAAGVIVAANESRVHVWPIDLVRTARERMRRALTLEELERFELVDEAAIAAARAAVQQAKSHEELVAALRARGVPADVISAAAAEFERNGK